MDRKLAIEVIRCLPRGRTLYAYGKDAYALQLLKYHVGEGKSIAAIKRSDFARLLNKPPVKQLLAGCGAKRLSAQDIDGVYSAENELFSLSLDLWEGNDDWSQTSRRGWNLVLQLNFCNRHNHCYREWVKPDERQILNGDYHPVFRRHKARYFRETLAWARLDIDFDRNECLIEEIQSDWVREVDYLLADAHYALKLKRDDLIWWPVKGRLGDIIKYCEFMNRAYKPIWAEAMLSATLHFIKTELGLNRVCYHSARSGAQVKNMRGSYPPRSLYSQLPRAFCFRETLNAPEFLLNDARYRRLQRKIKQVHWHELNLA
ncbi:MAG: hypothetical protein AAF353_15160 [Pseudomonadota bacterium]